MARGFVGRPHARAKPNVVPLLTRDMSERRAYHAVRVVTDSTVECPIVGGSCKARAFPATKDDGYGERDYASKLARAPVRAKARGHAGLAPGAPADPRPSRADGARHSEPS